MSIQPKRKEIKALDLKFNNDNELWLTSGYTLRKIIGILGIALPLLLFFFLKIESGLDQPLESLSHYYYTRAGSIFTIIVSLLAIFLIVYKGSDPIDFYLSAIAGIFALCVLLFPTDNLTEVCCDDNNRHAVTFISANYYREKFHYVSAAIFLLSLAYMSLFLFTRSNPEVSKRGENKKRRNVIFIICGIIMVAALLVIFIGGFLQAIPEDVYDKNKLTFWMEAVAVEAFGFSWLVKGEMILKDTRS
jgi:membrane protease YdiL (CAAX protease family)